MHNPTTQQNSMEKNPRAGPYFSAKHQINWPEILPLNATAKGRDAKILRFHEQQLQQPFSGH